MYNTYNTTTSALVEQPLFEIVALLLVCGIVIAFVISLIRLKIKQRKVKAEHEQALREVNSLGLVALPLGKYRSGLPATAQPGDMLVVATSDAFIFYPFRPNTTEVARILLADITEIVVEDKSKESTTFAYGFIVYSKMYKRFDLIIKYTTSASRLPEMAVFSFKSAWPQQAATQAADTLRKYVH